MQPSRARRGAHRSSVQTLPGDVSIGAKQAPFVEPNDPAEGGHFQALHVAPWVLAVNQLRFVEANYGFSEGVVIRVPNVANRWLNACFD